MHGKNFDDLINKHTRAADTAGKNWLTGTLSDKELFFTESVFNQLVRFLIRNSKASSHQLTQLRGVWERINRLGAAAEFLQKNKLAGDDGFSIRQWALNNIDVPEKSNPFDCLVEDSEIADKFA